MICGDSNNGRALVVERFPNCRVQIENLRGSLPSELFDDYALVVAALTRYQSDPEMQVFSDEFEAVANSIEQEILELIQRDNVVPFRQRI